GEIGRRHGLVWRRAEPKLAVGALEPAHWDYTVSRGGETSAEERRSSLRKDYARMASLFYRVVTDEIDWSLMARSATHAAPRRPSCSARRCARELHDDESVLLKTMRDFLSAFSAELIGSSIFF